MKIALVQNHIIWEDRERNISGFEKIVSENSDADLFLLPEMSFTGFSMDTAKTADLTGGTVSMVKDIAVRYKTAIGFGWVRKPDEKCANVYTVVDSSGCILSEYIKIHPFSYSGEYKYFTGGKKISVYQIGGIPFSTFICYDLRFPELFRSVCRDVHAVIIPANWPAKRAEHWKTLLRARAIENQVYVFGINCVGEMNGQFYSGDSCVVDPNGNVIVQLSDEEGIIKYDLNDDTDLYRDSFPVLRDIRTDPDLKTMVTAALM
ncbi:MAG: carbon-nitrogen family hydrolase [Flexilinea sp.]|nr:carbon-nitrogen family hydrolase [Flexilinea sp.]